MRVRILEPVQFFKGICEKLLWCCHYFYIVALLLYSNGLLLLFIVIVLLLIDGITILLFDANIAQNSLNTKSNSFCCQLQSTNNIGL